MSIKIEEETVLGWEPAIRGMRNPMNSWDQSDSEFLEYVYDEPNGVYVPTDSLWLGPKDLKLMKQLCKAGTDHRKFMRMIICYVDITAPLYWWKEFDTYRMGVEKNSCSTMHKIAEKEFILDDFSHEHLLMWQADAGGDYHSGLIGVLEKIIIQLNYARNRYLESKDKHWWWQMIQLLPSSYNQKRTCMISYEALSNMYHARKHHKLDEWREFCRWVEALPYSELITGGTDDET